MNQDFQNFLKANEGRIHYQIRRLGISGQLYEEFYSEGILALWQAYQSFDKTKGKIGTYINYRIRFRLIDLIRKKTRHKENIEQLIKETKNFIDDGNKYGLSKYPLVNKTELLLSNEPFWEEVKKHLSKRQWKWVKYFIIAELTLQEIAEIENTSIDAVKSWGREARKKLRNQEVINKLVRLY